MRTRERAKGQGLERGLESVGGLEKEPHEAMGFTLLPSSWAAVTAESRKKGGGGKGMGSSTHFHHSLNVTLGTLTKAPVPQLPYLQSGAQRAFPWWLGVASGNLRRSPGT